MRKALGDDAKNPRYIETVGGKGFRFIADVRVIATPGHADALEELIRGRGSLESLDAARLADALAGFERLVSAQPDYPPGHAALASFAREMEQTRRGSIYAREFQCDALVGTGYAHLRRDSLTAATDAFREALVVMPANGRALVGLARACPQDEAVPQLGDVIERVTQGGRRAEGALLTAGMHVVSGNAGGACAALESLVRDGEPRQDGWMRARAIRRASPLVARGRRRTWRAPRNTPPASSSGVSVRRRDAVLR
jgi:hypothetical protein